MELHDELKKLAGRHFNSAYITPETFCSDDRLQTAAGGLGVVADSYLCELETNHDIHHFTSIQVAVYCSHGYQRQIVKQVDGGFMDPTYEPDPYPELTIDTGYRIKLVLADLPCYVAIRIPVENRKHTARVLLDTDIQENPNHLRMITRVLYAEGHATKFFSEDGKPWDNIDWLRIMQAAVIGLGPYYFFRELGITYDVLHLNESHAVFYLVHDVGVQREEKGMILGHALTKTAQNAFYTCHTNLESGNKRYSIHDISRILRYYRGFKEEDLRMLGQQTDYTFSMTHGALYLVGPGHTNGVSVHHANIANKMWPGYDIIPITNGVSTRYQHRLFRDLDRPSDIPKLKQHFKEEVYALLRQRLRDAGWTKDVPYPDPNAILVTWARRGQSYKRFGLMWREEELPFVKTLLEWGYIAIAWGGYVHPDDTEMTNRWNEYWQKFRVLPNTIPVFNYRLDLMRPTLKAASQMWLNTPWFGNEACGTSWMSAALNCALNVSIYDGGVQEAPYCVPFGSTSQGEWHEQYKLDAKSLWQTILPYVLRLRDNDEQLLAHIFEAKLRTEEQFSSRRMIEDYIKKLYRMR